jgi:SAM-dependent methyltransferase
MTPEPHDSAATEAAAIAARYAARDREADALRYSLFDAAALQAHQERQRAMLMLWRRHGWHGLGGRDIVEVGCGAGGNLLDLLRLGADPERLRGIELLPDRVAAARACLPATVRVDCADATRIRLAPAGADAVLAFTVFSSVLDDALRRALAAAIWGWLRPGGGVMVYDFAVDNPSNAAVRALTHRQVLDLFPEAQAWKLPLTLAPPVARALGRMSSRLVAPASSLLPMLRTHRLWWVRKTA